MKLLLKKRRHNTRVEQADAKLVAARAGLSHCHLRHCGQTRR